MNERLTFEVWIRTRLGEKVQMIVEEPMDAIQAIEQTLERFNIKREDIQQVRVTNVAKGF